jgi:hypothetical protein
MTADDADAMVKVSYTFAPMFAALECTLLVGAFAALFFFWIGVSRLDLTIVKGPEWQARQVCLLCSVVLCCGSRCDFYCDDDIFHSSSLCFLGEPAWYDMVRHRNGHISSCG